MQSTIQQRKGGWQLRLKSDNTWAARDLNQQSCDHSHRVFSHRTMYTTEPVLLAVFAHQILLSTVLQLGITGTALRWFDLTVPIRWIVSSATPTAEASKSHKGNNQLVHRFSPALLFSLYTASLGPICQSHGFFHQYYADDVQLHSLQRTPPS